MIENLFLNNEHVGTCFLRCCIEKLTKLMSLKNNGEYYEQFKRKTDPKEPFLSMEYLSISK